LHGGIALLSSLILENPVPQPNRALRVLPNISVVCHQYDCQPSRIEFGKERKDFIAGAGIQRTCRFVSEEEVRVIYDCARNGDTLLLSTRELSGDVMQAMTKSDPLKDKPSL
jgi:hypothetical protein